jgi:hypothetical protein
MKEKKFIPHDMVPTDDRSLEASILQH